MTDIELLPCSVEQELRADAAIIRSWIDVANGPINREALADRLDRYANAAAELTAEIEALRAEVAEAREFRDKMVNAIGNDQLQRFIEKHGEPVPLTTRMQAAEARAERLEAEVERLRAEVARLEVIAGYGGVSSDAPERLILASEVYDGIQSCDKWCDVRRVVDDGQPMPEPATAYVRADRAERLAEALRLAEEHINAITPEWYSAGQRVLAEIRAALEQENKA